MNENNEGEVASTGQEAQTSSSEPVSGSIQELCDSATPTEPATRSYSQAEQVLEDGVDYQAIFCTDAGPIYVDLFEDQTPVTVNNFVFLAQNNYYDNTIFHRVIQDFMAQGGDPTGTGMGGPGYQFQDEIVQGLTFDTPGLLAMANAG
ncbi:MAG: peptidylprolyl isomerase, partial [Anaerolineae bacterium]|nr:peptidylprolyl isomerase [Anaerolineae bacterium]